MSRPAVAGSRLLARLEAEVRRTHHPVDNACLRAERACQLARLGQHDLARQEIDALHSAFDRQAIPAITAWMHLAEGCLTYYTSLSGTARDRMRRAHALSTAAQLSRIQALSAAWLAHMDYVFIDAEGMVQHVSEALRVAAASDLSTISRACMVVGVAYHYAERSDLAQPWYARARECASTEGDEATLSALVCNIAWHHANHAVQAALFGGDSQAHVRHALLGAEATDNIDHWIGITALNSLVPMMRAVVFSVRGQHAESLALYEAHLADARRQGLGRMTANFLADMAWCRWSTGDPSGALRDVAAAATAIDPSMHADDRAVAHALLAKVHRAAGDVSAALQHEGQARDDWRIHQRLQAQIIAAFEQLPPLAPRI